MAVIHSRQTSRYLARRGGRERPHDPRARHPGGAALRAHGGTGMTAARGDRGAVVSQRPRPLRCLACGRRYIGKAWSQRCPPCRRKARKRFLCPVEVDAGGRRPSG